MQVPTSASIGVSNPVVGELCAGLCTPIDAAIAVVLFSAGNLFAMSVSVSVPVVPVSVTAKTAAETSSWWWDINPAGSWFIILEKICTPLQDEAIM